MGIEFRTTKGTSMLPGKEVMLAGKSYIVPELNFRAIEENHQLGREFYQLKFLKPDQLAREIDVPMMVHFLPLVHAAIKMNYPEVSLDELRDSLNMSDLRSGEFFKALVATQGNHIAPDVLVGLQFCE